MRFDGFVGNESIKKQLAAEIDGGRFPHAILLEGAPGTGRRTLGRLIARAALCRCEEPSARPCGVCAACQKEVPPDLSEHGGDGTAIPVDTIRRVREDVFLLPNESAYRVILLADAHLMGAPAQNALLKILEEPPAHAIFILTCDSRTSMLPTIQSRCVCMTLSPVSWEQAAPILTARLPKMAEEDLHRAHSLFGGAIGQVLDGVSDGAFRQVLDLVPKMAEAIVSRSEADLMLLCGPLEKEKELLTGVLTGLSLVCRDALVCQYGGATHLSTAPEVARMLSTRLTGGRIIAMMEQLEALRNSQLRNMNNTLLLTRLCACLRQAAGY
ncbi:MAG: hypothetical protein IIX28_04065 [Clostridia bacterium]|nr:hypothetical protein [Clostridia bacterium]